MSGFDLPVRPSPLRNRPRLLRLENAALDFLCAVSSRGGSAFACGEKSRQTRTQDRPR